MRTLAILYLAGVIISGVLGFRNQRDAAAAVGGITVFAIGIPLAIVVLG